MDNNLLSICDAIGIPGAQDLSTQASDILASITGERRAFDISGQDAMLLVPLALSPVLQGVTIQIKDKTFITLPLAISN